MRSAHSEKHSGGSIILRGWSGDAFLLTLLEMLRRLPTAAFQELDTNLIQKEEIKTKYLLLQMSELTNNLLALADIRVCGCKIPIRSALCYVYSHFNFLFLFFFIFFI